MTDDLVPVQTGIANRSIEVVKIKYGEKIDRPGIYDIPMGWYHSDCCVGPSISSSGLRTIYHKSPLHYWDESPLNPNRAEETPDEVEAAHFRIGRAAHTLLLEPLTFRQLFVARPSMWDSWRTKDAQRWRAEHQIEGFTVLDPAEMQRVIAIHGALKAHPLYQQGILEGDIERSLIWQDAKTGIWLKSRPDAIPFGTNVLADLKVVTDARNKQLSRKIFDLGYDVQMALGGVGMFEVLRRKVEEFAIIAVETNRPHGIRIAPLSHAEIFRALSILRWSINKFAECLESGDWPSFEDDDNNYIARPDYDAKRLDDMIESGKLPKEY